MKFSLLVTVIAVVVGCLFEETSAFLATSITRRANDAIFFRSTSPSLAILKVVAGPDSTTKPDYDNIHGPFGKQLDTILLKMFRSSLAKNLGIDSALPNEDYAGILELVTAMNARFSNREEIQRISQDTLRDLFPKWLPGQYAFLFSKPFPRFSARMNAWATRVGGTWLMGECEVNDIEIDGEIFENQGLLVKRCRFLEESGCASVCVNACKIPTQNFFIQDMGLPLSMTPDYETHECQFSFGVLPTEQEEAEAKNTPCLSRCPTAGGLRKWHDGQVSSSPTVEKDRPTAESVLGEACQFMEEV